YWRQSFLPRNREFIEVTSVGYRPIIMASFALDFYLWKLNPFGYHLTNLLLHILNVILLYFLIYRLVEKYDKRRHLAFLAALFFATHPMHTESVTWIKNRSDLFGLLFFLLSFLFFIKHISQKRIESPIYFYAGALIFFIFALLSKAMAVTLPLILVLYAVCFLSRKERNIAIRETIPFFGLLFLYLMFKATFLGTIGLSDNMSGLEFYPNVLTVIKTLGFYVNMLLFPIKLNAERIFNIPGSFFEPEVFLSFALLCVIIAAVIKIFLGRERGRYSNLLLFSILWIFVTLLPVSNIIFLHTRPIAEQRLYFPSVGFCLFFALGIKGLSFLGERPSYKKGFRNLAMLLTLFIAAFYSVSTVRRNFEWRDPLTFWSKTLEYSPNISRVHNNLGIAYYQAGRYKDAIRAYKKAIEISADDAWMHYNLGIVYRKIGKDEEAMAAFKKAIEISPRYGRAYDNIGTMLYRKSAEIDEVIRYYKKAIELKPNYANAYNNLGWVLFKELGQVGKAVKLCKKAIKLKPGYANAYNNLGLIHSSLGLYQDAVRYHEKAIELRPDYADAYNSLGALIYNKEPHRIREAMELCKKAIELESEHANAYYNFGMMLNTIGLYEEAVMYCKKAIELKPDNVDAYNSLGIAYRYLGQYEKAIESFEKAIGLKPDYLAAYNNLALVYYYDKELFNLAKDQWEKILEIDPFNETAKKALEYLEKEKE
ncbi:MAG: tetratricopeptide repeat protein, partial [Candidatus Omnitrophica bacterium]|nr:tetratricopeptide repeat protein [Candidatus Omnitrophota bacterium]